MQEQQRDYSFTTIFARIFASNLPRSVLRNGELLPRSLMLRDRVGHPSSGIAKAVRFQRGPDFIRPVTIQSPLELLFQSRDSSAVPEMGRLLFLFTLDLHSIPVIVFDPFHELSRLLDVNYGKAASTIERLCCFPPSYSFARIFASNLPRSVLRNADALPSSLILRPMAA